MKIVETNTVKATKRKRVSKKKKSSWRKHVDISDVDNFLEEQRLEERLGRPLSTLRDEELFVLDTTSTNDVKPTSKQLKRQRLREAPPRYCSLLRPLTNVPDPISKRNRVRTKEERKNELLKKKELLNRAKGVFKKKDLQVVKDIQKDVLKRQKQPTKFDFDKDLWDASEHALKNTPKIDEQLDTNEWIVGDAERHILRGPGKPYKAIPKTLKNKSSAIEAVEVPHPGMSYNPSFDDHQDLLRKISEKEQKIIKEEKHLKRVTSDMFRKVSAQERDNAWMVEMSQGLPKPGEDEKQVDSDGEFKSINPPVKNKKKSLKQRRKQKEELQRQDALKKRKEEKKKLSDIQKIKQLNNQIEHANKKAKLLHEKRLKKLEYKKREAKRLGLTKFEEPDLEFNMGPDIAGNLRGLKKEGNLLNDRFKSLQKRSLIEPTLPRMKKKAKVKKYTRPGHKEGWQATVARPKAKKL